MTNEMIGVLHSTWRCNGQIVSEDWQLISDDDNKVDDITFHHDNDLPGSKEGW